MTGVDSFFKDMKKTIGNDAATVVAEGTYADNIDFIDTGSYVLNALYSGSLFKGMPGNKINALAGEEATGKTFFMLGIAKNFLDKDPESAVILFESEGAITKDTLADRNIDVNRVLMVPVSTVEQFNTQAARVVQGHLEKSSENRRPLMICLDSLGMLSTKKEMEDTSSGKDTKDMTRTQKIRATFRVLTLALSQAGIPMILTNHVYQSMGMFPTKEVAGGGGLKYASNNIIALGKAQYKVGDKHLGSKIRCKIIKSRLTREKSQGTVLLTHDSGLDRYFGLIDLALEAGVFTKVANKIQTPSAEKPQFQSIIEKSPEKFFSQEILEQIDKYAQKKFCFGAPDSDEVLEGMLNGDY